MGCMRWQQGFVFKAGLRPCLENITKLTLMQHFVRTIGFFMEGPNRMTPHKHKMFLGPPPSEVRAIFKRIPK
jgi:hypothetical protein